MRSEIKHAGCCAQVVPLRVKDIPPAQVILTWLTRRERRGVTLETDGDRLEVTGTSSEEQQRLINVWISRHPGIMIANE